MPSLFNRPIASAAVIGAALLASPLAVAYAADSAAPAQGAAMQGPAMSTPGTQPESVEQRIATLHSELKITADEESKWNAVAQAMRENAANMQKLAAEKSKTPPQNMTAVDDLKAYQQFSQAHVDGLKNLISSFSTLYNAMPADQKKVADDVFESFGSKGAASHS
jgi:hypothetical protein